MILSDEMKFDAEQSREELVLVAKRMVSDHPEVGAVVLECTNMPPLAAAIQREINLPIFDIYTLVVMVYHAVVKKDFSGFE
ncbi:MAG: aspartate/glutamate racemase family protein [Thermodesulfobacteriota bacterium]